jgi:hypothetical protein
MRIIVKVVDPVCVKERGTAFKAVDLVALGEQEFG